MNLQDAELERFAAGARSVRNGASLLPFLALALFLPPIVMIFAKPVTLFGVPLAAAYLFAVWAFVIAAAFLFSRRLGMRDAPPPGDHETG
ncbi:MAG: hypothetical protein JJ913_17920 [Rhizobiaceae bacterium]|nr:hypothetical protein [Rhizobiaceae bacterium]